MSKKNRAQQNSFEKIDFSKPAEHAKKSTSGEVPESRRTRRTDFLRKNWWAAGFILLLALGTLGAGLKYLDESAQREMTKRAANKNNLNNENESLLNKINPFLSASTPAPTPQLSKEYLYAGSRLLAVEDANATAAPPADLAVWRPSSGQWWVMGSSGSQQTTQAWGIQNDVPVPGDYDGDGKTDFSIFRPSTNEWYVMRSSDNSYFSITYGANGDIPAQADYDGDGKTDAALFRPSTGTWFILQSSNNQSMQGQFGNSLDTPAPADYDGDGRADFGVWRDSAALFTSLNSSNGQSLTYNLASSGSQPVSADYDGDGRADYAVRNGSNWIIQNSSNNTRQTVAWQAGEKAVQNDYDADGKVDVAVWRNADGMWFIRQSSKVGQADVLRQVQWGMADDIPVSAFWRR